MADKYERWNKWAPQFIADLMHDFGFTAEQAAGFVGNFAAESAYFNDIVEDGAIAKGWTGPRRRTFEAWIRRKGWKADSYEGNYSYLFRELKGIEKGANHAYVVPIVKAATSAENAAWRVAKHFERPAVINLGPRAKAAKEALELYRKNPVPPTKWATDKAEPSLPAEAKMPEQAKVIVTEAKPAQPIAGSIVMQGVFGGVVLAIYAMAQAYDPALSWKDQPMTFWTALGGLLTALWTAYGRISSKAQPLTLTQDGADAIAKDRVVTPALPPAELKTGDPIPGWGRENAVLQPAPAPVLPMEQMSIQQFAHELPDVVRLFGAVFPQLAVLSKVGEALSKVGDLRDPTRDPRN
jgi:hypothetical protein